MVTSDIRSVRMPRGRPWCRDAVNTDKVGGSGDLYESYVVISVHDHSFFRPRKMRKYGVAEPRLFRRLGCRKLTLQATR